MKITKGDIVNGTYSILRISGLTINASPEEVAAGIQEADDLAGELKGIGVNVNWQYPSEYGISDPNDTSGLTTEMAGAFKSVLALRLLDLFGKQATPTLAERANKGMRTLEQITVSVASSEPPSTLPFGSGNEWDYRDQRFYPEPAANNDATYVFLDDILNYTEDFSAWVIDEELESAEWQVTNGDIDIQNVTFDTNSTSAQLTFTNLGGFTLCITVTKTNSTDKFSVQKNFIVRDCERQNYSIFGVPS